MIWGSTILRNIRIARDNIRLVVITTDPNDIPSDGPQEITLNMFFLRFCVCRSNKH